MLAEYTLLLADNPWAQPQTRKTTQFPHPLDHRPCPPHLPQALHRFLAAEHHPHLTLPGIQHENLASPIPTGNA